MTKSKMTSKEMPSQFDKSQAVIKNCQQQCHHLPEGEGELGQKHHIKLTECSHQHVCPADPELAAEFDEEVKRLKVVAAKRVMKANNKRERERSNSRVRDGVLDQSVINKAQRILNMKRGRTGANGSSPRTSAHPHGGRNLVQGAGQQERRGEKSENITVSQAWPLSSQL